MNLVLVGVILIRAHAAGNDSIRKIAMGHASPYILR